MHRRSLRDVALVGLGSVALLAACGGGGERPTALSDDVSAALEGEPPASGPPPTICLPGYRRECTLTYVDANGHTQCPTSWQFCNDDGTDWYPCGEIDEDAHGNPLPPANPSRPRRSAASKSGEPR